MTEQTTPYKIDTDMLGPGFAGTLRDLHDFVPLLAEVTGRPVSDFLVEQHLGQAGAEEPSDQEWTEALERFAGLRPELFPEVY